MSDQPKPPWRELLILAAAAGLCLGVVSFSPLREYLTRWRELSDHLRAMGWLGPVVLGAGVAVLVAVGFPRLLLCVLAGMTLGFWSGLFWAQAGTLLGNYAIFLAARFTAHDWAVRVLARRGRRLHDLVRNEGIAGVILARQLPVPGLVVNLACGLLPLRHRQFLVGTVVGQLPEAIPCTLIGAGALSGSFAGSVGLIGLAVGVGVAGWFGLRWYLRRQRSGAPAAQ